MKRTMQILVIVSGAALAGCSSSEMSGTSQQQGQAVAWHDSYRAAYEYSGSPVPMANTAQPADDLPAQAAGHR